jgi:hypothetical protein
MPRTADDLRGIDLVKQGQHLDVRELRETLERERREFPAEAYAGLRATPAVVLRRRTTALHDSYWMDFHCASHLFALGLEREFGDEPNQVSAQAVVVAARFTGV